MERLQREIDAFAADEAEEFPIRVRFSHSVTTTFGSSEITGLYQIDPELKTLSEFRFATTYEQAIRVQTSPTLYNYARLTINFAQNYERNQEQLIDSYFTIREIYTNYRDGEHQFRWGTQIYRLGKVDFDRPIDVLHLREPSALNTLDFENTKEALPTFRYQWLGDDQTVTAIVLPLRQTTVGMRFTDFRESVEAQEESEREDSSFLRDYLGVQYHWFAEDYDLRFSFFHWFDYEPAVEFDYERYDESTVEDDSADVLGGRQSAFERLASSYTERETRSDFFTVEGDFAWGDWVWKFDLGLFDQKNLYSYDISADDNLRFRTVKAPYRAFATSLETTSPYFFVLGAYSLRYFSDVPAESHILFYENQGDLAQDRRDLWRHQFSGVVVAQPYEDISLRFVAYQTFPFEQTGFLQMTTWEVPEDNTEWSLKMLRFLMPPQEMLGSAVTATQLFIGYRKQFRGS